MEEITKKKYFLISVDNWKDGANPNLQPNENEQIRVIESDSIPNLGSPSYSIILDEKSTVLLTQEAVELISERVQAIEDFENN